MSSPRGAKALSQPPLAKPPEESVSRLGGWLWLLGPTGILLCAAVMQVGAHRAVSLPWIGRLPETCAMYSRFGMDCPGCGLTRCFVHLAHGQATQAWEVNAIGVPLFAFVVLQLPLASLHLLRIYRDGTSDQSTNNSGWRIPWRGWLASVTQWNQVLVIVLMIALAVRWVGRLLLTL